MEDDEYYVDGHEDNAMGRTIGEREIWPLLDVDQENLIDNTSTMFYPPLPDFPCMSSSSSSSPPAPANSIPSSSTSWAVLKSNGDPDRVVEKRNSFQSQNHDQVHSHPSALSSTSSMETPPSPDCMDVIENLEYMDLIDSNDIWDPSSIFEGVNLQQAGPSHELECGELQGNSTSTGGVVVQSLDEMGAVFFEWLKCNKEYISAEDMRSIKIKRATIESASKRLGTTKEGQKQLLKLILEWVEQHQLQKNRFKEEASQFPFQYQEQQFQNPNPNPNPNPNSIPHDPKNCISPTPCIPPPPLLPLPYVANPDTMIAVLPPPAFPMVGYIGTDPYSNQIVNGQSYPHPTDYNMVDSFAMASQYNSFEENNNFSQAQAQAQLQGLPCGYGNQLPYQYYQGEGDQKFVRLGASATKEARKKRMARQRRVFSYHRHQNHNQHHQNHNRQNQNQTERCNNAAQPNSGNWVYWPSSSSSVATMMPPSNALPPPPPPPPQLVDRTHMLSQNSQRHSSSDRRQGWKCEKNLKFLLQKVLKQSDVNNLGRIVLPKKEAETHLPELDARDGIPIAMEDIGTSRVWNMRYRFWPNNKSRMYLLENAGDFVKANGLEEGDFIVIYLDIKCDKYLIRGVKVRQPGPKPEGKRPSKGSRNLRFITSLAAGNG